VRIRFPDRPTRNRACFNVSSTFRSVTSDDQGPVPNFAVSAPAAALCNPASAGTSLADASRNLSRTDDDERSRSRTRCYAAVVASPTRRARISSAALTVVAIIPVWLAQRFGGDPATTRV